MAFSARYRGPKRAPHRRKTHPEKRRARNGPNMPLSHKKRIAPFFDAKTFRKLLEAISSSPKTAAPKRHQTRNPQKRSVSRFSTPRLNRPTPRNRRTGRADKEPQLAEKGIFVPIFRLSKNEKGAKIKFFGNFSDFEKNYFCSVFAFEILLGLLISSSQAPYQP